MLQKRVKAMERTFYSYSCKKLEYFMQQDSSKVADVVYSNELIKFQFKMGGEKHKLTKSDALFAKVIIVNKLSYLRKVSYSCPLSKRKLQPIYW
mmetsp:Transcript_21223/g.48197  ORF Transcript_21223/g.48197 Transcript_21223/m.48197 type:complete len:94 (-) Transcript_21223:244-525(-)